MHRSATALDMLVREGNTKGMNFRVGAGVAASSVRKSDLQYILQKVAARTPSPYLMASLNWIAPGPLPHLASIRSSTPFTT